MKIENIIKQHEFAMVLILGISFILALVFSIYQNINDVRTFENTVLFFIGLSGTTIIILYMTVRSFILFSSKKEG